MFKYKILGSQCVSWNSLPPTQHYRVVPPTTNSFTIPNKYIRLSMTGGQCQYGGGSMSREYSQVPVSLSLPACDRRVVGASEDQSSQIREIRRECDTI